MPEDRRRPEGIRRDESEWAEFGRAEFAKKISRIEMAVQDLPRLKTEAAEFFQEERRRGERIEKLLKLIAEKGGATPDELAVVAAAVKDLDAESVALQSAADRANQPPPTKE